MRKTFSEAATETQSAAARESYLRAVRAYLADRFAEADDGFAEAIGHDPNFVAAWIGRGLCQGDLHRDALAVEIYTHAMTLDPQRVALHQNRGVAREHLLQWDAAIEDFTRGLELDPEEYDCWNSRGCCWLAKAQMAQDEGDPERAAEYRSRAMADFDRSTELAPGYSKPWVNRGLLLAAEGELEAALAEIGRGPTRAESDALQAVIHAGRGEILILMGRLQQAREEYDRAVDLDPKELDHRLDRAALLLEMDPALAERDLDYALERHPDQPDALCNRGLARMSRGDSDGARADLERAAHLRPSDGEILGNLAAACYEAGDVAAAEHALARALALSPHDTLLLYNRAVLREEQGDTAGARADLERVLILDPGHAEASERQRALSA